MNKPLAIIGGGLAGLAAAAAAVERGLRVELFEQATSLGGRAGSFVDSTTGQRIDYCQHVAMGCCTSFLDFCRRTQIEDCFERQSTLHFIAPEGTQHDFSPSRWLPAPLHLLPGLVRLTYLSWRERWSVIRTLTKLVNNSRGLTARGTTAFDLASPPDTETIGAWLRRHNQSERALERFWSVVLVSALGETVDRASLAASQKVFRDGFLASRQASELILPRRPLGEIFHDRVGKWLTNHGVTIHLGAPVRQIEGNVRRAQAIVLPDGTRREFDFVIAAVPWRGVKSLFSQELLSAMPDLANVQQIEPAAITAVHLWFDRPITPLPHAVLVGRLGQWLFADAKPQQYCQVVISASHRMAEQKHDELIAEIRGELEAIWPNARDSRLLHARVVTQPSAVFSVTPGLDRFRPPQKTPIENVALAGDWTATGWPATMEGAIRSGYQAVEQT